MGHNLKCKLLSAVCAFAMLLSLTPAAFAAGVSDVKSGDCFYDAVSWARPPAPDVPEPLDCA